MTTDPFWVKALSWIGAAIGLAGSYLVASGIWLPVGFSCYVLSSTAWVACSVSRQDKANFLMQLGFIPPGLIGLARVLG